MIPSRSGILMFIFVLVILVLFPQYCKDRCSIRIHYLDQHPYMIVWARLKMILKQDCCHYLGDQTFEEACRTLGAGCTR